MGCVDASARAHTLRLRAQCAALGGRCSWCIKMDFRGCMGEALIILPAQLASWGVAAGGMGGTPSGTDSSRLARRRVGASAGGQCTAGACSACPHPHCTGGRGTWEAAGAVPGQGRSHVRPSKGGRTTALPGRQAGLDGNPTKDHWSGSSDGFLLGPSLWCVGRW